MTAMPQRRFAALVLCAACLATPAEAHFLTLLPSSDVLPEGGPVTVSMIFTHPFEGGPIMPMARPARFGMLRAGETIDLADRLEETPFEGVPAWSARVDLAEPGPALFFVAPEPYWEPAERKYIVHYAKVLVDSFATGEGWDAAVGLPAEILPLTRPTGLWTGNVFQGIATRNGAPVPFAEVEVEFVNDGAVAAPNDAFVTQVIKADAAGVFTYAMPRAGWWGFAALFEGDAPMTAPDGASVPVEEGALIWVRTVDMAGG